MAKTMLTISKPRQGAQKEKEKELCRLVCRRESSWPRSNPLTLAGSMLVPGVDEVRISLAGLRGLRQVGAAPVWVHVTTRALALLIEAARHESREPQKTEGHRLCGPRCTMRKGGRIFRYPVSDLHLFLPRSITLLTPILLIHIAFPFKLL